MHVLLVDDDDGDVLLITDTLRAIDPTVLISRAFDGQDMLDLFDEFDQPPDLVLLDLNMPGVNGHEALQRLRRHWRFNQLPVVIFTTSSSPRDIDLAYANGANAYVQKPRAFDEFEATLRHIHGFWLKANAAPSPTTHA